MALRSTMGPRLRALHRAEDIGSALKRGVNVCQQQLVNEVLGPLVTEFVRNFGREGATPIQLGLNGSLFDRVQAVRHSTSSPSPSAASHDQKSDRRATHGSLSERMSVGV